MFLSGAKPASPGSGESAARRRAAGCASPAISAGARRAPSTIQGHSRRAEPVCLAASAATAQWRRKASRREERARVGSRKGMRAAPSFRLASGADAGAGLRTARPGAGATLYRAYRARAPARARPRAFRGGAVRAPDCPRARQAQDAPRLSAESGSFRAAPARAGSGSGCLFPRTHHSTFSENASPIEKNYINLSNNLLFTSAGRRIDAGLRLVRECGGPASSACQICD